MQLILLIAGHKWFHPHGDDQSEMTKRIVHESRNITELKKYGCVCTCYHRSYLPWYKCVIFVKHNYNLNICAVANELPKWYREIRQKEFICKPCYKELKDGKYSKNVQNCPNSDMFGFNVNDDQDGQHNVQENRIYNENNIIYWIYYTELCEEQIAIKHRQELTGDPLLSVVQFENLKNQIYQCAPGENIIPKYILLDNDFEVLAFPDLSHMVVVATIVQIGEKSCQSGNTSNNAY